MKQISKLLLLYFLVKTAVAQKKLNFFMDRHDILEIKYDLLLSKEQQINDLEAEARGPIILSQPTEPEIQKFRNINQFSRKFPIEGIIDVRSLEHHIFYLFK